MTRADSTITVGWKAEDDEALAERESRIAVLGSYRATQAFASVLDDMLTVRICRQERSTGENRQLRREEDEEDGRV